MGFNFFADGRFVFDKSQSNSSFGRTIFNTFFDDDSILISKM